MSFAGMSPPMRALAIRSAGLQARYGRQAPKAPPAGRTLRPDLPPTVAPRRPVSLNAAQEAALQARQAVAPQLAAQGQQASAQNNAIKTFALALLGKLQPIPGQIGADYNQAIGQTAALSGAASNALANANPNQQDQTLLQSLNAPAQQGAQVQSNLANTFGGGAAVTLFNQGQVPGTQLATDKAAAQTQAAGLPALAGLQAQQDLRNALYTQGQDRSKILAQEPGIAQTALQNIRQNQQTRAAAAWDQQKFWQSRADAFKAAGMKAQAAASQHKADLAYKYASQQDQNARTAATITGENQRTQAQITAANARTAAQITASNARAAATLAARTGAKGALKPSDRRAAIKAMDLYYYGKQPKTRYVSKGAGLGGNFVPIPGTATPGINYGQAIKQLTDGYGMTRAQAMELANDYYAPGERGRPMSTAYNVNPTPSTKYGK